ncbi:ankyrin repeat protein [Flavobacterium sp. 9]|uniref:ankyrin repeat domain-containing protein n=1 Tax=Flavobacterium sp. 9 TaxID=2035198 RepID=UPI000C1888A4|nr:ankyrin repeat domain-containing protein [Flavobacterium sp. 9]PIF32658.1 ankyrin repeat protein [Flavobacterium sp. 9]
MKKLTIYFAAIFFFISCNNRENIVKKENLLGYDYRLFQNTSAWELAKAVDDEDTIKIREILNNKKVDIDFREPKFGNTLLMLSIKNSQFQITKLLLILGANPNVENTYRGGTAVIFAANNNDPKYLELILKYKGNPNSIETAPVREDDQVRQTALLAAINLLDPNSLEKVKLLVESGANINYHNLGHTESPLSDAITARKMDVILYLLQKGADYNLMMYEMVDGHKVYILEALRKCIIDLESEQYKSKLEVIQFLKEKGLDYSKEPIPDYIGESIKKKYPKDWEDYIKKY